MAKHGSLPTFEKLPPGCVVVKVYHAGYALLECQHEDVVAIPTGLLCRVCKSSDPNGPGVRFLAEIPAEAAAPQTALF